MKKSNVFQERRDSQHIGAKGVYCLMQIDLKIFGLIEPNLISISLINLSKLMHQANFIIKWMLFL